MYGLGRMVVASVSSDHKFVWRFYFQSTLPCFERNMADSTTARNVTVQELEKELKTVVNWFGLGVALGMPPDVLNTIRIDRRDTASCRVELFIRWKEREKATWPKVIDALKDIGLLQLARDISEKYNI